MTQNLPATQQLSTLSREISVLNDQLVSARDDEIAQAIGFLIDAGLAYPSTIDIGKAIPIYCYALSGVPAFGLKRAVERLIKGEVTGVPLGLIPRPPEMAALARLEVRHLVDQRARSIETKRTLEENEQSQQEQRASRTPEAIARVKTMRENFKLQQAEMKNAAGGSVDHEPDEERAEHWAKINALPDASIVTAEQKAFRRRVKSIMSTPKPEQDKPPPIDDEIPW